MVGSSCRITRTLLSSRQGMPKALRFCCEELVIETLFQ